MPAERTHSMGALLPCGRAGFVPHTSPESAASAPVADVADYDALQAGELHPLSIQLQLFAQTDTQSKQAVGRLSGAFSFWEEFW